MEYRLRQGGRIAQAAFEERRPEIEPKLAAQQSAPTTGVAHPERPIPEDFRQGPWIHRTSGGWDGHDYQGFVHGELAHRQASGDLSKSGDVSQ